MPEAAEVCHCLTFTFCHQWQFFIFSFHTFLFRIRCASAAKKSLPLSFSVRRVLLLDLCWFDELWILSSGLPNRLLNFSSSISITYY